MDSHEKEMVHYASACFMLAFGCCLCLISLFLPPVGIIDSSVLWFCGQAIVFAASIFGAKSYIDYRLESINQHGTQVNKGES